MLLIFYSDSAMRLGVDVVVRECEFGFYGFRWFSVGMNIFAVGDRNGTAAMGADAWKVSVSRRSTRVLMVALWL